MKLFALSGSLRAGSFNGKLIRLAAAEAQRQGAEVTLGDFRALAPPLYDADLEAASGFPPQAQALIGEIEQAEAMMIATPEYNYSVPGPLKNAFDWVSRVKPYRFKDKPVLLMGASSGGWGAVHGMDALRITLNYQGAAIHPDVFSVQNGKSAFDDQDRFADGAMNDKLAALVAVFLQSVRERPPV
jgi:NAD(P)H-dependent FMN reductase